MVRAQAAKTPLDGLAEVGGGEVLRERTARTRRQTIAPDLQQPDDRPQEWFEACREAATRGQTVPRLAGDDDLIAASTKGATDQCFALSLGVHVGCVEEVHARVVGSGKQVEKAR